jgi:hypothetical protein
MFAEAYALLRLEVAYCILLLHAFYLAFISLRDRGETSSYEVTTQLAALLWHCSFPRGVLSGEKLLSNENSSGAPLC